jgi:exopolyphosphatase/guanosine-5'-triphosphate,3'-diphosphate pyrophosphatase
LEHFQLPAFYYSAAGVRDGLVADLAARKAGTAGARLRADQRRVVEAMARKFTVPLPHARKVAALSMQLFEALGGVHRLPPPAGGVLEAAAILFDIGHFVSDTGHHKHSEYLIANSDLPGFTDRERVLIAALCRFHRKSMPGARHAGFQALPADDRRTLLALIPLLRMADALDIRKEQLVDRIECTNAGGVVQITALSVENIELELWAASRAGAAFEEVFATPVEIKRGKP